jgi:hypothetical protein
VFYRCRWLAAIYQWMNWRSSEGGIPNNLSMVRGESNDACDVGVYAGARGACVSSILATGGLRRALPVH